MQFFPRAYYLLGWNNEQFAVYYGAEYEPAVRPIDCIGGGFANITSNGPRTVLMWNAEYNTYGNGSNINLTYKYSSDGTWKKYYNIHDRLGNVRTVLRKDGTAGTVVKQFFYTPFGSVIPLLGNVNRTKFIGKEKDKESNYADHGVRKYDDEIGRFTSIDPLWEKYYSLTPYQYAGNNPVSFLDGNGFAYYYSSFGFLIGTDGNSETENDKYITNGNIFDEAKNSGNWSKAQENLIPSKATIEAVNSEFDLNDTESEYVVAEGQKGEPSKAVKGTIPGKVNPTEVINDLIQKGDSPRILIHSHQPSNKQLGIDYSWANQNDINVTNANRTALQLSNNVANGNFLQQGIIINKTASFEPYGTMIFYNAQRQTGSVGMDIINKIVGIGE